MEPKSQTVENSQTLVTLARAKVHRFTEKKGLLIATGSFSLFVQKESTETSKELKTYYLKVKDFQQPINSAMPMTKIIYQQSTSFLFEHPESGITSFSFKNSELQLDKLNTLLGDFVTICALDSDSMSPTLTEKINLNCPQDLKQKPIYGQPQRKTKAVGNTLGGVFGAVNALAVKPLNIIGQKVGEKKNKIVQQKISEGTKAKWNNLTEKSNNLNDKFSNAISPAVKGYYNMSNKIGQKFFASENFILKAVRQYSVAFAESMSNAELNARYPEMKESASKQIQPQMKQQVTTAQLR